MNPVITPEAEEAFAGLEYCIDSYLSRQALPVMDSVWKELTARQQHERAEYMCTPAGALAFLQPNPGMAQLQVDTALTLAGEWNSRHSEDYLDMCRERFAEGSAAQDLGLIASEWRRQAVELIGQEAYDARCAALGQDVATAYVAYRLDRRMVDYLIAKRIPADSAAYVIRKGVGESLLGLFSDGLLRSGLDSYVEEEAARAHAPSLMEKGLGKTAGFTSDLLTTGGFGSWSSIGRLAITEAAIDSAGALVECFSDTDGDSVEQCISSGIFGSDRNIMEGFRRRGRSLEMADHELPLRLDDGMEGRMGVRHDREFNERMASLGWTGVKLPFTQPQAGTEPEVRVPFLPGFDPDHPESSLPDREHGTVQYVAEQAVGEGKEGEEGREGKEDTRILDEETTPEAPGQSNGGWGGLLGSSGLEGLGSTGRNLGYVIAMLPDMLLGTLTGRTESLGLKDNLVPLASILVGLFVRNPLLKTLLVGLGGMNLLNKAGQEALTGKEAPKTRYRSYGDEPLSGRISQAEIRGGSLFLTIDGVPSVTELPQHTLNAYREGALPLNPLANAVLARHDEMAQRAGENYDNTETRGRSRTMGL